MTEIVFLPEREPVPCDAIFVFGGTHPGHWEKAVEAYRCGLGGRVIVTGGRGMTGRAQSSAEHRDATESDVIAQHLSAAGVPDGVLAVERMSTNTLENVLEARKVFPFAVVGSVLFVCKSHVAGRAHLSLSKHLPARLRYVPYTFDAEYGGVVVGRGSWNDSDVGRSRVWGEYLRICLYGDRGDIRTLDRKVSGLEDAVAAQSCSVGDRPRVALDHPR